MQQKLENFFIQKPITQNNFSKSHKLCFIYDPASFRAYFSYYSSELVDTHEYITSCNVKTKIAASSVNPGLECSPGQSIKLRLYYKKSANIEKQAIPKIETKADIPLLKSNLQKAIRRQNTDVAIQSAIVLMAKDHVEFVRRLSIIEIEDVCLFDHYSIIVWLSMAGNQYILKPVDQYILLGIVATLCRCPNYYEECYISETIIRHEYIENMKNGDALLSLLYRIQYGGMSCDIQMLKCSLVYYTNTGAIHHTDWNIINDIMEKVAINRCEILPEAIDYHPYPSMLRQVAKEAGVQVHVAKEIIWNGESSLNTRKPIILEKVKLTQKSLVWKKIIPVIESYRNTILNELA